MKIWSKGNYQAVKAEETDCQMVGFHFRNNPYSNSASPLVSHHQLNPFLLHPKIVGKKILQDESNERVFTCVGFCVYECGRD